MPDVTAELGRRERNKRAKLERITAAASELFAVHGIDDVTTQQIADRADIGTGTLFLYAKSKSELLLLVQNSHYADALEEGRAAAEATPDTLQAVLGIARPIVACNRVQVDNGRTYLRELAFGDAEEPHHREALSIVARTEELLSATLLRDERIPPAEAPVRARIITAILFLSMATAANPETSVDDVMDEIATQLAALLGGR
ncbi:TetR/AcrR family transcriptional regulator [Leifsonia sp. 2MCAF36]|uniref:TetR/AcrR family transcriptional regulator n=1 Tax=Leifsonia sp. 2MCAF36 TaxID=3232988 RepID=UPI003F967B81